MPFPKMAFDLEVMRLLKEVSLLPKEEEVGEGMDDDDDDEDDEEDVELEKMGRLEVTRTRTSLDRSSKR